MSKVLRNVQSNAWRWLVGAAVAALVAFSYFLPVHYYYWQPRIFQSHGPMMQAGRTPAEAGRRLILLYWTSFFESKDFGVGTGSKPFSGCHDVAPGYCLTTTDRGLLNDSDAVIFHGRDLNVQDLPPPGWRRPHQIFVFFLLESPVHTNLGLLQQPVFRHYFNRTMTYRRDSDVLNPYGRLLCNSSSSVAYSALPQQSCCVDLPPPAAAANNGDNNNNIPIHQQQHQESSAAMNFLDGIDLAEKNRTVAWFVSNCQTNSRRESLVRNLSQFVPVDVYGRCGDGRHQCASRAECDRMLSRHYRFYLSFENSLCPDYVTEKLFRPLAGDTVPVVYGGADYSHFLPAGSYVDARHFGSPEALADYLKKLAANDTLYLSYLRWRGKYTVDPEPVGGWCPLCRFLRDTDTTKETKTYSDMAAWWSGQTTNRTCQVPPATLA